MMETMDLREAALKLAPEDQLDRRQRHGHDMSKDDAAELKGRREAVVNAGYRIAKRFAVTKIPEVGEVSTIKGTLDAVKAFLEKPTAEAASAVKAYLGASDLVEMVRSKLSIAQVEGLKARVASGEKVPASAWEGELVQKAAYASRQQKIEYYLLLSCFTQYASDAASYLWVVATTAATILEKSQTPPRPGGWGHPMIWGVIATGRE